MAKHAQYEFTWPSAAAHAAPLPTPQRTSQLLQLESLPNTANTNSPPAEDLPSRWDFVTKFPEPLKDAIDNGLLDPSDATEDSVRAIHEEHAEQCLRLLQAIDALEEARRQGTDPRTRKKPRTDKARQNMEQYFTTAPAALTRQFDDLMAAYERAFGQEAANSFRTAVHVRHRSAPLRPAPVIAQTVTAISPGIENDDDMDLLGGPAMPHPLPLESAVQSGAFGYEETGEPIYPAPDEIQAITEHHAERLMELRHALQAAENDATAATQGQRQAACREKDGALSAYQAALGLYAEDFGDAAAQLLDAWVHHQVDTANAPVHYDPGHPWYYLKRGDNRPPMPVDQIPPAAQDCRIIRFKLPRDRRKRNARLREMLRTQRDQLQADRQRYIELVENGIAAVSQFDRTIAHDDDDELAWASAVALKHRHIANDLSQIARIERQLHETAELPDDAPDAA